MSRHRHVRNLCADDYMYEYDEDDDHDDRYDDPTPPQSPPQDNSLLADLTALFREALNDPSIPASAVDAAVTATNYDVDAAVDHLRRELAVQPAQLADPSPIAQMLSSQHERTPAVPDVHLSNQFEQLVSLETGPVLRIRGGGEQPFAFDRPSPDDAVVGTQRKGAARAAAVRMPKASSLRKNVVISESEAKRTQKKPAAKKLPSENQPPSKLPPRAERKEDLQVKQRVKKINLSGRQKEPPSIAVVVAGHVDAGKSTLLNHFLELLDGRRHRKDSLAWGTDEDPVERAKGVTIDIATRIFKHGPRSYALIDAPGHRDFVPAMILGAAQASAGLLVVDASPGEFEAGFKPEGQTREHAVVLRSLGVGKLIVVVNKMDRADWNEQRYDEICETLSKFFKRSGWKIRRGVTFLTASGRDGVNLTKGPDIDHPLTHWYTGKTLLQELESLPGASTDTIAKDSVKPTRLIVSDFFRSTSLGGAGAVTGRLVCGSIAPRDKLRICPGDLITTVKNVEVGSERVPVAVGGVDSLPVSLGLNQLTEGLLITPGNVLCDPQMPVPCASRFRAQIVTTGATALIMPGTMGELYVGGGAEAVSVVKLQSYAGGKRAGKVPRRLVKGDSAIIEIECRRGIAVERSEDVKGLGRFVLRREGITVAVGIVLEVLETREKDADDGGVNDEEAQPSTML